jgi:hypothetical protein
MKYIFKKYEFESQYLAETRIAALPHTKDEDGNSYPSHSHTVVKLGYIFTEQPTFDEDGEVLTEGVQSDMYSIDVLWNASEITETDEEGNQKINYPYGWSSKEIEVEGNGVHTFFGINYSEK